MKKLSLLILQIIVFQATVLFGQGDYIEPVKKSTPEYSRASEKMDSEHTSQTNKIDLFNSPFENVVAVAAPFVFSILVVFIVQLFNYKRKKDLNNLLSKYLETGKEIPVELITNPAQPKNDLRRGLVWGCLGIAILIGAFTVEYDLLLVGLVPLFIGIAFTLSHFLIKKDEANK